MTEFQITMLAIMVFGVALLVLSFIRPKNLLQRKPANINVQKSIRATQANSTPNRQILCQTVELLQAKVNAIKTEIDKILDDVAKL